MSIEKFIDSKEVNIHDLFSTQQVHKVPLHQRVYTWTKEQWEEFFDDITQLDKDEVHFLGSIVVIREPLKLGVNFFQIQDGQQRLATIVILMTVLRDLAEERGIRGSYQDYLYAKDYKQNLIPRLRLSELDNDALRCILEKDSQKSSHRIFECYNYFHNRIKKEFQDNLESAINELWEKLLERVYIIHINAYNDVNAFQLFETLNDRGLELSAVDLIKNFLFQKASGNKPIFNKIVPKWNEMFENVRDKKPIKFFRRCMLSSFKGKVSERKLNKSLRNIIKRDRWNENGILDFVEDITQKSAIYKHIYEADFESENEINKRLRELQLVEVAPSYTLLLKVFPFYKKGLLDQNDILTILSMIEIFHIRWGICGQSTSSLDTIYNEICMEISSRFSNSLSSVEVLQSIKEKLDREINANVDNTTFQINFLKRIFKPSETRTKYILWKLSKPTGETLLNISEIETEHITPQTLSPEWEKYLRDKSGLDQTEIIGRYNECLNMIGNLTIIKGEWNTSMSNRLFEEKKNDYYKNSELSITKELYNLDDWTFEEIEKRSDKLSKLAVKIWKW